MKRLPPCAPESLISAAVEEIVPFPLMEATHIFPICPH